MTVMSVAQSIGGLAADLSFLNFKDLVNLVLGFALLVLLVLLVKEVSGSRH